MVKKSLMYLNLCIILWCVSCQSEKKEKKKQHLSMSQVRL
jgi:hypothetical protein